MIKNVYWFFKDVFHLPCIIQILYIYIYMYNIYKTNKRTSVFVMYFIHNYLATMFGLSFRPSSR